MVSPWKLGWAEAGATSSGSAAAPNNAQSRLLRVRLVRVMLASVKRDWIDAIRIWGRLVGFAELLSRDQSTQVEGRNVHAIDRGFPRPVANCGRRRFGARRRRRGRPGAGAG